MSDAQYGFRSNMSTSMALIDLLETLGSNIDKKLFTVGVFIDLKKAFDTIDHSNLIRKLEFYGIRGLASKWLTSYISSRQQFVSIDGVDSELKDVLCGVPQGSILGPKLFILYINDISRISMKLNCILFADDTNIFCSGNDLKVLCESMSLELKKLNEWFSENKLSLNILKTSFMVFSNRKIDDNVQIKINNYSLERVYVTKFLGILIDSSLTWKSQIATVYKKICKNFAIMVKLKSKLYCASLLKLYNVLIQPHLTYCTEVWGLGSKTDLLPIIRLQKKAIRCIVGLRPNDHTSSSFKQLNVLKFTDLMSYKLGVLMYRANNGDLPRNIQSLFNTNCDNVYLTRQSNKFKVKYARTRLKASCPSICGVKLWNNLDVNICQSHSLEQFKKKLKINLLSLY